MEEEPTARPGANECDRDAVAAGSESAGGVVEPEGAATPAESEAAGEESGAAEPTDRDAAADADGAGAAAESDAGSDVGSDVDGDSAEPADRDAGRADADDAAGAAGGGDVPVWTPVWTPVVERSNRVHWFAGRVHEVLSDVTAAGVRVAELSAAEAGEAVLELTRAIARLEGVRAAVLAHADTVDVGAASGATSTGAWLAHAAVLPAGRGRRLVKLATRLERSYRATAEALQAGGIEAEQAQVIADAVDALPDWVPATDRVRAEAHLLGEAKVHDAQKLKVLGKHLLAVIDPEGADAELAKKVAEDETRAERQTSLAFRDDGKGTCRGRFAIPSVYGAMLSAALGALVSPTRPDPIPRQEQPSSNGSNGSAGSASPDGAAAPNGGGGNGGGGNGGGDPTDTGAVARMRHSSEVLGEAFCQFIERFPTAKLPATAGGLVTVVVTIPLSLMLEGLGVATLSSGGFVSVGQVRRLACHAGIIPAVLGTKSQVLDLGRKTRPFSKAQRLAMTLRDGGCTVLGCDRPAGWCHGHHIVPWSHGGPTDLANGRLLCPRHHTLVHHPDYEHHDAGDGRIRLVKTNRRRQ